MPTSAEYLAAISHPLQNASAAVKEWLAGKDNALSGIKAEDFPWKHWGALLMELVPDPGHLGDDDLRALRAVVTANLWRPLGDWLRPHLHKEPADADWAGLVLEMAVEAKVPRHVVIADKPDDKPWDMKPPIDCPALLCMWFSRYTSGGRPNSAGRRLLELPESEIGMRCWFASKLQDYHEDDSQSFSHLVQFLTAFRGKSVLKHLDRILDPYFDDLWLPLIAPSLLDGQDRTLADRTLEVLVTQGQVAVLAPFYRRDPPRFRDALITAATTCLEKNLHSGLGDAGRSVVAEFIGRESATWAEQLRKHAKLWWYPDILQAAVRSWKLAAMPLLADRLDEYLGKNESQSHDISDLLPVACAVDWPELRDKVCICLQRVLGMQVTGSTVSYEGHWGPPILQAFTPVLATTLKTELTQVIEHEDRLARTAAQRAFALVGDEAQRHAATLLQATKSSRRMAGAGVLAAQEGPAVARLLLEHLNCESDPDVRDICHVGLARDAKRLAPTADTLARWRELQTRKAVKLPTWFKPADLPKLRWRAGGKVLDQDWLAFLVLRQQRADDVAMDAEAGAVLDAVAPEEAAEFADQILNAYLGSKIEAKDRFALAIAARLGDDRIVDALAPLIPTWAEKSRSQLACWAVDAIAIIASERAIVELERLSERFRTRIRNVGQQADEGLRTLAAKRGVTVEELGDAAIPTCGFAADGRQTLGKLDLILRGDGVVVPEGQANPKKIPKEAAKTVKQVQAEVRAVIKHQGRRHERMLVNQRRWPAATWLQQYRHPLLRCFAIACCWAAYAKDGTLLQIFRQLDDGTFTDATDDAVQFPKAATTIGLVHPLDLDAVTLTAWRQHLTDHEVEQPFAQLSRAVHLLDPQHAKQVRFHGTKGAKPYALTFRGRADKRGWVRGSVCDGGGITTYYRRFPIPQIDVFISIEDGVHIGNDRDDMATLGSAWFVSAQSVRIGSYTYDEPRDDNDPRLLPFGKLPALVWSEAMDDCAFLSGRADDADGDDEAEG